MMINNTRFATDEAITWTRVSYNATVIYLHAGHFFNHGWYAKFKASAASLSRLSRVHNCVSGVRAVEVSR